MDKFRVALLFPGQGSQYGGMGAGLYREFTAAKQTFEEANDILGFDIKKMCFEGQLETLTRTENTQPALLTVSVAAFRVYKEMFGIKPGCALGNSLGEISALTCAGAIAFPDALHIVRTRGKLMQEAVSEGEGAMAAVSGIEADLVKQTLKTLHTGKQIVVISNYNTPLQTIISGHQPAVSRLGKELEANGATLTFLKVSAPFHSPLMEPAAQKLKKELEKYSYNEIEWDIISNVAALPYQGKGDIVENLTRQMTQPVRWQDSMLYLKQRGIHMIMEIGPKAVLKKLAEKNIKTIPAYSFDIKTDVEEFAGALSKNCSTFIGKILAAAAACRNRNTNLNEYNNGVVEPYEKIEKIQDELDEKGAFPTVEQMKQALEMLRGVFSTKKVPVEEQVKRFNRIFDDTGTRGFFPYFKMPVLQKDS